MKTAHATAHGTTVIPELAGHRQSMPHDALVLAERTASAAVLLTCEVVILWVLISSIYFSTWPVG
ncbi:MAG TPA: hypothetical protein VF221_19910 [Chloroflexota bacterium]